MRKLCFAICFAVGLAAGWWSGVSAADPRPAVAATAIPLDAAKCGDGRCSPPEDCNTCPQDCGKCCGNRKCEPPEDCNTCPEDCGKCK
jgi:hypothetical protein